MPNERRTWPYSGRNLNRDAPVAWVQTPDVIERTDRSLAGPLRLGTESRVGPRGFLRDGTSDFGTDRVSPRGFDPMGTSDTRAPPQESSQLVSRERNRNED